LVDASLAQPSYSEDDLIQSICRESFYEFVKEFWDTIIPDDPVWNWHIEFICNELQKTAERVFAGLPKKHDVIINVPPGSTKSTICSVMFPAWVWTIKPKYKIICGSYTFFLAMELSRRTREVINSDKYRAAFPEVRLSPEQFGKQHFMNTLGGSRMCVGVGGTITGMHAHIIIIDDPLDPQGAKSEADLKKVNAWMSETLPTRKVNKRVTPTILIMQRLHQNDPTGNMIEKKASKIRHICLPAELADNVKPGHVRRFYKDGLLDPVRLDRVVLKSLRADLGEFGYAGQAGQNPVPLEGGMFKVENLQYEKVAPARRKFKRVVRFWDKAGTGGDGAYTVGIKMGWDLGGRFWILDVVRGQWEAFTREKIIKNTAKMDGPEVEIGVEQEPGSGGKESAQNTVRNLAGYSIVADLPRGDKVFRADPFAVQVNGGNVIILIAPWNLEYINEMQFFPFAKFKDQIDASSAAFAKLFGKRKVIGGLKKRSNAPRKQRSRRR